MAVTHNQRILDLSGVAMDSAGCAHKGPERREGGGGSEGVYHRSLAQGPKIILSTPLLVLGTCGINHCHVALYVTLNPPK